MVKKITCVMIALFTLLLIFSVSFTTVAAENLGSASTADEATADEGEIVITDEANISPSEVEGTVIGYVGDVDLSQNVNIKDATSVQKHTAKIISLTEQSKALADTDLSGNINIKDATLIQKYLAKVINDSKIMCLMYETGSHTHNYIETVVTASCYSEGYNSFACICGDEYRENVTPIIDHNYVERVVKPTCTEKGYTEHTCSMCKDSYKDNYVDAKNHSYSTRKVAPTCIDKGYTVLSCVNCDYSYNDRFVEATGRHNYNSKNKCKGCSLQATAQEAAFDKLSYYIIDKGTYTKKTDIYECSIDVNLNDDEVANLYYTPSENTIGMGYGLVTEGYLDITTIAFERGKSEGTYIVLAQGLYDMTGILEINKISENSKYIDVQEAYIYADITEEEAAGYTLKCICDLLDNYNQNRKTLSIPVTLKELGFKSY